MKISRIYALLAAFSAALLLALAPRAATATATADLFTATVPVADQTDTERERGFRAGLHQVAVKLTGQRAVLADPGVAQLVATAPQLVERYDYVSAPAPAPAPTEAPNPEAAEAPGFLLHVSYSAPAVDAALRGLHLPLWPAQRPQLLLFASGRDADSAAAIEVACRVLAERGVPVAEPLWDLEDRRAIGATEAGFDTARIEAVAHRYGASHWLALDPDIGADAVRGHWRLGGAGAPITATATADSLAHWVEASVGDAVDRLAARLAYLPQFGAEPQTLVIENVRTFAAYRAVLETLKAMEFVRGVEVIAMAGDRLDLELQLDSDPNLLWAALDSNPQFGVPAPAVAAEPEVQPPVAPVAQSGDESAASPGAETGAPTTVVSGVEPAVEPPLKPQAERRYLWREP
ncbi:MAG: DUF2066 domain-containing protein [Porticoccaceae bacterium]